MTNSPQHDSQIELMSGPCGVRMRDGLKPTMPQQEPGMRSDPPPSPPCAMGTTRAATEAALPPLEPPVVRSGSQGLRQAPRKLGAVVALKASLAADR